MNKKMCSTLLCFLLALALMLSGCTSQGDANGDADDQSSSQTDDTQGGEYPVELRGTLIQQRPDSVVSLSPALSELVQDMGLGGRLSGVSDYCDNPDNLQTCGSPQQIDFDEIFQSGANLVISSTAPTEEDITKLQQMNIDLLVISRASDLGELKSLYQDVAIALEGSRSGTKIGDEYWGVFESRFEELAQRSESYAAQADGPPTVIFLRILNYTMATGDTFESRLLSELGFENLAQSYGDWTYPESQAAALTPDLIISNLDITIPILEQNSVYRSTQAVIQDQVVTVDMAAFERQTPRMLDELERVADFLFDGDVSARSPQTEEDDSSSEGTVI